MVVQLLGFSSYSFPHEKTGELIEGVTCHFKDTTLYSDFKGCKSFSQSISNKKLNGTPLTIDSFYDLNFNMDMMKKSINFDSLVLKK